MSVIGLAILIIPLLLIIGFLAWIIKGLFGTKRSGRLMNRHFIALIILCLLAAIIGCIFWVISFGHNGPRGNFWAGNSLIFIIALCPVIAIVLHRYNGLPARRKGNLVTLVMIAVISVTICALAIKTTGWSSTVFAMRNNYQTLSAILIRAGIAVNLRDGDGQTPLAIAAKSGDLAAVRLLISKGADVNGEFYDVYPRYFERQTPLQYAILKNNEEMIALLLDNNAIVPDKSGKDGTLIYAATHGRINVIKMLLARGAQLNSEEKDQALFYAAGAGNTQLVELLLDLGAELNTGQDSMNGETPLIRAAMFGRQEIVSLLITRGAKLDIQDKDGKTALMHANQKAVMEMLLRNGADPNQKDKLGWTALNYAVKRGDVSGSNILRQYGARDE